MTTTKLAGAFAAAVLAVSTFVSVATATRPCGARVCSDEIAAACAGETGRAFRTCKRAVVRNCRRTTCTCDGSGVPCDATPPTTTTTTPTSTTTTTTIVPPPTTTSSSTSTTHSTSTSNPASTTSSSTSTTHSTSTSSPASTTSSSTSTTHSTSTSSSTSSTHSTSTSTSTTSTTSSSTSTTLQLGFTVVTGTTNCGAAGLTTPPAAPTAGSLGSTTGCTGDVSPLGLGCLYFGGGMATVVPPGAIPDGSTSFLTLSGSTLTGRATGNRDTCTVGAGPGTHCINNNSVPACATDGNCGGAAGACALDANCFFGPPLPIVSPAPFAALTTCVLNAVQTTASGTATTATGASSISLPLSSRVYISGNTASPCPKCLSGSCDPTWKTNTATTSPDTGAACTAVGTKMTSNACRPSLPGFQAPLPVSLNPLTTGTVSMTSATGMFCPQNNAGAFGQATAQCITETGQAAGNLGDRLPHNAHLVSVFCIPATGNAAVDGVADLPGPGAFSLNGNSQVQ